MRYRTPRAFRASSSARSADVRMTSNTGQAASEPLGGRELETSQTVVHVAYVDPRIGDRDRVSLAPQRLAVEDPVSLLDGQAVLHRQHHALILAQSHRETRFRITAARCRTTWRSAPAASRSSRSTS